MEGRALKTGAITTLLLLALLAPAVRAWDPPEEPVTVEEAVFVEWSGERRPPEGEPPFPRWLPEGPHAAAEGLVRRIGQSPLRVHATAYRFDRLPAALQAWSRGNAPVLAKEEADAVAARVRDGSLTLVETACAAGPAGIELHGRSLERRNAVLGREVESAQSVVVSFPDVGFLREGLRLRAKVGLTAAQGVTLRYHVVLASAPMQETRHSLGGSLDHVSVPALLAEGTVRLVPGDVAAILRVEAGGAGRLFLLSVTGRRPDVEAVTDLGDGCAAVLAGHLEASEGRPAARAPGVGGIAKEAEDDLPYADAWEAFAEVAGVGDGGWEPGPCGLRFGAVAEAARAKLAESLAEGAALRGTRSRVDVARPGWGRMSLPVAPGTAFRFFAGTVGTTRGGTEVQSGCNTCVLAAPRTARTFRGLQGAGWACVDGTVDVDLVGREVLHVEHRSYAVRRIEAGYLGYARDPFALPLVKERTLACRGALPRGEERLPGGTRLRFGCDAPPLGTGRAAVHVGRETVEGAIPVGGGGCLLGLAAAAATRADSAPVRLVVSGEPLPVRPGVASWVELLTHHPFVRRWDSDGWCGMRLRYPVPDGSDGFEDGVRVGASLALRARHAGGALLIDVSGELRGEPEDLGPFDPGDGVVDVVRSPRLVVDVGSLPLGGGGRLAHGAGLALVVDREGVDLAPGAHLRLAFRSEVAGAAGLLTGRGAGGLVDAGADWLFPSGFTVYSSNHATGHVSTAFASRKDGVVLRVEPKREHARVDVVFRSRPSFEPCRLRVDVEPDRPEAERALLRLRLKATDRVLHLDVDDRLEYRSPDPSLPYEVSAHAVSAGGGK